jgi:hypothetical protein
MRVKICQKYTPFTTSFGEPVLIPGTYCHVKAYPGLVEVYEKNRLIFSVPISCEGPVHHFIVTADLVKQQVQVSGKSQEGFFRYSFLVQENDLYLRLDKGDTHLFYKQTFDSNQMIAVKKNCTFHSVQKIQMTLGQNKKLDWDKVKKREDLQEILPQWCKLASCYPQVEVKEKLSMKELASYFKAGFSGIFTPQLKDPYFQNLFPDNQIPFSDPFKMFSSFFVQILDLFITCEDNRVRIPKFPFISGRIVDLNLPLARVNLQWSKYRLKFLEIFPIQEGSIVIEAPHHGSKFRIRKKQSDKGTSHESGKEFALEKGSCYLLDRFTL